MSSNKKKIQPSDFENNKKRRSLSTKKESSPEQVSSKSIKPRNSKKLVKRGKKFLSFVFEEAQNTKQIAHKTLRNARPFFDQLLSPETQEKVLQQVRENIARNKKNKKDAITVIDVLSYIAGLASLGMLALFAMLFIWLGTVQLPDLQSFNERIIASSTKIYDETGEIVLFDIHDAVRRTVVPLEKIQPQAVQAIIAIEDADFYKHKGIDIQATIRSIAKTSLNVAGIGNYQMQGGSTITQQVIKNTLLTDDRKVSRKLKEWFLAPRLERELTKQEILEHYLNELPYGGQIYGIETASQIFFGISASELSLAQSAYLAAIPNAPSVFSPYKQDTTRLEKRKNLVLDKMYALQMIRRDQYEQAKKEVVVFKEREESYAKAIHFVEYVREELAKRYGDDVLETGGLSVITTLDYKLQQKAEEVAKTEAEKHEKEYGASNMAIVALDPTNGHIKAMVGSRGYSDPLIDGKFNVATSPRQPGSSFKPFVYAAGFELGYTDSTILYDVKTQFTPSCGAYNFSRTLPCYSPNNADWTERGPLTIRQALAQSRNIPAVKMAYLVGVPNAIKMAQSLGVSSLTQDPSHYGLSIVLGGGEVSLLEMTSAYGAFGNGGVYVDDVAIKEVRDNKGNTLFIHEPQPRRVMKENTAAQIASILSDNNARSPLLGYNSFMNFGGQAVGAKTGTTNDQRDAWVVGFHPRLAVGVWSGNNDNTPMKKGSVISGPAWRSVMSHGLSLIANASTYRFAPMVSPSPQTKPILRGIWQGDEIITIDTISGKRATEHTPIETRKDIVLPNPHSILHYVDKRNPQGPRPVSPERDEQYRLWEAGVMTWITANKPELLQVSPISIPDDYDDVHTENDILTITATSPITLVGGQAVTIPITVRSTQGDIDTVEVFVDGVLQGKATGEKDSYTFTYQVPPTITQTPVVSIKATDEKGNKKAITTKAVGVPQAVVAPPTSNTPL